jgi:hypothetical protein
MTFLYTTDGDALETVLDGQHTGVDPIEPYWIMVWW